MVLNRRLLGAHGYSDGVRGGAAPAIHPWFSVHGTSQTSLSASPRPMSGVAIHKVACVGICLDSQKLISLY